jgi:hypothetical protein
MSGNRKQPAQPGPIGVGLELVSLNPGRNANEPWQIPGCPAAPDRAGIRLPHKQGQDASYPGSACSAS